MLYEKFLKKYDTDISNLKIGDKSFKFFVPRTIDRFIDSKDILKGFPLWAKIWNASLVLANYVHGLPQDPEKKFLEIGAGIGVVGIVAASFGHHVTMTEYNADARNFLEANAQLNLTPDHPRLRIIDLDWNMPESSIDNELFDYIIGSEVVYKETDFEPMLKLFTKYLKEDGEVILAEAVRKTSIEFFKRAGELFQVSAQKRVLSSKEGEEVIILARLRKRNSRYAP